MISNLKLRCDRLRATRLADHRFLRPLRGLPFATRILSPRLAPGATFSRPLRGLPAHFPQPGTRSRIFAPAARAFSTFSPSSHEQPHLCARCAGFQHVFLDLARGAASLQPLPGLPAHFPQPRTRSRLFATATRASSTFSPSSHAQPHLCACCACIERRRKDWPIPLARVSLFLTPPPRCACG